MDYTIDNYRDMATEYRLTAMSVLSNIMRKEKLIERSDTPQKFKEELQEEIITLRGAYDNLVDLELIMVEKMEEMKKKRAETQKAKTD